MLHLIDLHSYNAVLTFIAFISELLNIIISVTLLVSVLRGPWNDSMTCII